MPRITTINSGAFSISSSVLSLERETLEEFYEVTSNVSVIDEGDSVIFSFQYRNIDTTKTIYWEIVPSENITYEDFSTLMNGTFQIVNSGLENITITAAKDFTNIDEEITENFTIRFRETDENGNIIVTSHEVDILDTSYLAVGQQEFTTPGLYLFTVPENVIKISVVLIGGGAGSNTSIPYSQSSYGPGGGALVYCNNIPVQPGQKIVIGVGKSGNTGTVGTDYTGGSTNLYLNSDGSDINAEGYILWPNWPEDQPGTFSILGSQVPPLFTDRLTAGAGSRGNLSGVGGTGYSDPYFINESDVRVFRNGGDGGDPRVPTGSTQWQPGGAGSAGGYSANGVKGGNGGLSGVNGQGGSGGSAAGSVIGSGGGTGIWGEGTSGAAGFTGGTNNSQNRSGKAGSKLTSTEVYARYGGGAGITYFGTGAVRIIWPGQLRQYPTTRTPDETPIP